MKKILLLSTSIFLITILNAQEPIGYYDGALGLNGPPLRSALHDIIDNQAPESYSDLWDDYYTTDRKPNGKIWDMYSDIPGGTPPYEFTYGTDQCGNYNSEADCYNREHTWPKSKFNEAMPMYTDLFLVMPTDGYVNGKRSDYPYGKVNNPTWTSQNGSKLGPNVYPGAGGGTCFEPIDSFKGDLARSYFYVSTRYYGEDAGWENWEAANGAELTTWTIAMLLEWSHNDPVSQKEIDRNNGVYAIQGNRNPFIDHPEFIDCIWGSSACNNSTHLSSNNDISNLITVYPNPAKNYVTINTNGIVQGEYDVMIYNIQGQLVLSQRNNTNATLNISELANGMYILKLYSGEHIGYKKLMIR